jgi:hypothetical protein
MAGIDSVDDIGPAITQFLQPGNFSVVSPVMACILRA